MTIKKLPQLHLDNQLCFSVYSLSRQITQAYQPLLKPLGLTYPQYLVMLVLWQDYEEQRLPVSVKHLCQQLMLDTGTITPLLKRMESNGLLTRQRSEQDERVVLVMLSEEGIALRDQAASVPIKLACGHGFDVNEAISLRDRIRSWLKAWR
ncbi:MarR family winged helix-turn-helix transcriptional regulator [Bacterioplanoides sp.]|uniref:MarR family winged helix-turn-helix transcriptional regulator n=1 Tax=Bacterioplanoides sp. TaxID=2066072 RepID=UPI003B5AB656